MSILKHLIISITMLVTLAACGGGGSSTTSSPKILQGVFLDAAVSGISYTSGSISGTTGPNGTFLYELGATITFKVGDIVIGTSAGQPVITPISFVPGAVDETNPTVINIVQFLLTIDADKATVGIQITAAINTAALQQSIDFTLTNFDTNANTLNVISLLATGTPLVEEAIAQSHLNSTLLSNLAGIYNGTYSGADTGTWSIEVSSNGTITGTGCSNSSQTSFSTNGTVNSDGSSALGFANGATYTGNFSLTGSFSGTWSSNAGADTGSFSGAKAASSSLGNCTTAPPTGGGGSTGGISGNIAIAGTDTPLIGTSFIPVFGGSIDLSSYYSVILFNQSPPAETGTILIQATMNFSSTDDSPTYIGIGVEITGSTDKYFYHANCLQGDNCSGITTNKSTSTVTLSNVLLIPSTLIPDAGINLATDNITLNGTLTYSDPAK